MPMNCNYHPDQPAAHLCPKCNTYFCSGCIVKRKSDLYNFKFICPKCNIYTKTLLNNYTIEPFWKRLPKIFKYPLRLQPIILLLILAAIFSYLGDIFLLGILVKSACFGVALTYSFAALTSTVHGDFKAPSISMESIHDNFWLVFKQLAIFLIFYLISKAYTTNLLFDNWEDTLRRQTSGMSDVIFILTSQLLLPAMIIILAETKSILAAINPRVLIMLVRRIGWAYLLMCFFLDILVTAPIVIAGLIGKSITQEISTFLITSSLFYYMLVAYHLMGYILFQYHEQFGYEIVYDGENEPITNPKTQIKTAATMNESVDNELLNKLHIFIKEGNLDEALSLIREETHGNITNPILAERYFNLLQIKQMNAELLECGKNYIPLLIKTNQKDKLCEVYLTCKSIDEHFITDASSLFMIAKSLNEKNNHVEANQAFKQFIAMNDKHPMVPDAYFFVAKILNEKLGEPIKASELIKAIIKKYPFHENTVYIKSYLKQIKT